MSQIAVPTPPSLSVYRDSLREFFAGMMRKLDKNSHKRTPETNDIPTIIELLQEEIKEFMEQFSANKYDVNSLIELFDVSNFAFLAFHALRNEGVKTPKEVLIEKYFIIKPKIGKIYRKKERGIGSKYKTGEEIKGSTTNQGYIYITLGFKSTNYMPASIPRSHLIWWKAKGKWPIGVIDHKNRIKNDDRISNLRDVSFSINNMNCKKLQKYPPFVIKYAPANKKNWGNYGKFMYSRSFMGVQIRKGYYAAPNIAAKRGYAAWKVEVCKIKSRMAKNTP